MKVRLRWRHWTVISLLLVFVAIETWVKIEQHIGALEVGQVIASLHAARKPTTIDDLRALSPPVDAHLQNDWNTWTKRIYDSNTSPLAPLPYKEWCDWIAGKVLNPPAGIQVDQDKHRELMGEAQLLLRNESLIISSLAWLSTDFPAAKKEMGESDVDALSQKIPNLLAIRMLAEWLKRDLLLSSNPADDLGDLDRLDRALSHPALIIDAMIALAVTEIRNQAYLELEILGRLPNTWRDKWIAELAHEKEIVADGLRGERILFAPARIALLSRSHPFRWENDGQFSWNFMAWPMGLRYYAVDIDLTSRFDACLRGEIIAQLLETDGVGDKCQTIGGFAKLLPSIFSHGLGGEANHRLTRLAARILAATQKGSALPSSQGEIVDLIGKDNAFDPGGDCLKLRYDRIAPDRFSLSVDPRGPFPPLYDWSNKVLDHAAFKKANNSMIINKLYVEIPVKSTGKSESGHSPQHNDL